MSFRHQWRIERRLGVQFTDNTLSVSLRDGRTITVPLVWYPRLLNATPTQRENWKIAGGGYGLHWPDLDEIFKHRRFAAGSARSESARSGQKLVGQMRRKTPRLEKSRDVGAPGAAKFINNPLKPGLSGPPADRVERRGLFVGQSRSSQDRA